MEISKMNNNEKYKGWANKETGIFYEWITNNEPLYKLTGALLRALEKEREIQQVDIEFGMVAHAIIQALQEYIAQMNLSNDDRYKPYVEGWMRLKEHTGDISKVDKFELSDALMEFL
tara:strand:- start:352 stop:702 length:351 start_codon:yes stop_codon:yes gene_type:complete